MSSWWNEEETRWMCGDNNFVVVEHVLTHRSIEHRDDKSPCSECLLRRII